MSTTVYVTNFTNSLTWTVEQFLTEKSWMPVVISIHWQQDLSASCFEDGSPVLLLPC